MSDITEQEISELFYDPDLMAALAGETMPTREHGQGVTAREYAKCYNISESTATRTLRRLVNAGKMREEQMSFSGKIVNVFFASEQ